MTGKLQIFLRTKVVIPAIVITFLGVTNVSIYAQLRKDKSPKNLDIKAKGEFYRGEIHLTSGDVVEGELQYHYQSGVLYKRQGERTLPFTANNVISFNLNHDGETRSFYSIPHEINGAKRPVFFEVLYEKKQLAILRNHYVEYKGEVQNSNLIGGAKKVKISNTVYLVNGSTGIQPFLEVKGIKFSNYQYYHSWPKINSHDKIGTEKKLSYKIIDGDLPVTFFSDSYEDIIKYADKNDLKFNRLDDLYLIMDYYIEIK